MSALGQRLTLRFIEFLIKQIFAVLIFIFVSIGLIFFAYLTLLSNQQIHQTAIDNAKSYSQTLSTFRSLYTSEVIVAAEKMASR
ncbi:MAG: hypothetical protein HRU22_09660 [Gammaproteobacteria bacterium]|nr:hypothetical protein [Gammaproteobacteria bacterium]